MQDYLIRAGFNLLGSNDQYILVEDPRWNDYRVYSVTENPDRYINPHTEAPYKLFEWASDAAEYAGISGF